MSTFVRILKIIGRALRRAIFAIGRFFKFTAKKIGASSKTSRLNKRIAKKTKAIEKLYSEIGRNYYEAHSDAPEALLSELCGSVGENKAFINEAQDKIDGIRDAYATAKEEAKEKAKARRAADKAAAKKDKAIAKGEIPEEPAAEPVLETAAAAAPVFVMPEQEPVSAPVEETPAVVEEAPVVEEPVVVEESPVVEEPVVAEEAPAVEEPVAMEEPPVVEEAAPEIVDGPAVIEEPAAKEAPAPEIPREESVPAE